MRDAENGDVIKVDRWHGIYTHFGVYVLTPEGEESVIHYTGENGHSDFKGTVRETSLDEFLDGAGNYSVWEPDPDKYETIYSGEETVERARSCLSEEEYSLIWNNCEHFARWCKVGKREASQVRRAVKGLGGGLGVLFAVLAALVAAGRQDEDKT